MNLAIVTELIDWVRPLFTSAGYVIVAAATFLETAAFISVVVPGDVVIALGGVYAGRGDLTLPLVILVAVVFGNLGQTAGYLLGRRYGEGVLHRLPLVRRFEGRIDEARESIRSNAGKTIAIGRFVTGAAGFVPFMAGASSVPPRKFFSYAIPTVTVWATAITLVGFIVGNNVETIDKILRRIGLVGLALLVIVVGSWIWRHRRRSSTAADADD
jgi:membrane-associated protein